MPRDIDGIIRLLVGILVAFVGVCMLGGAFATPGDQLLLAGFGGFLTMAGGWMVVAA